MKKMFFLEDDDGVAEVTQRMMNHLGAIPEITRAKRLSEAVVTLVERNFDFDVALLDYSLPDGLGTTLMETLRRKAPHCKIIVYSSYIDVDADTTRIIRRQGPDVMLSKPFNNDIFQKALRDVGLL